MTKIDAAEQVAEQVVAKAAAKVELDPKAVYEARFKDGLSWEDMRAKFGVRYNSTRFYQLMAPWVAGSKAKAVKENIDTSAALARAVAHYQATADK